MDDQAQSTEVTEPIEATNDANYFDLTGSMHAIADALERLSDGGIAHLIEKIRHEACKLDAALKAADTEAMEFTHGEVLINAPTEPLPAAEGQPSVLGVSDTAGTPPAEVLQVGTDNSAALAENPTAPPSVEATAPVSADGVSTSETTPAPVEAAPEASVSTPEVTETVTAPTSPPASEA